MDTSTRDLPVSQRTAASVDRFADRDSALRDDRADRLRGHELFELRSETTLARLSATCAALAPQATVHMLDGSVVEASFLAHPAGLAIRTNTHLATGIQQLRCVLFGVVFVVYVELAAAEARGESLEHVALRARWFTFDRRHVSRLPVTDTDIDMLWFDASRDVLEPVRARVVDLTPDGLAVIAPQLPDDGLFPAAVCLGEHVIQCTVESRRRDTADAGMSRYGLSLQTDPDDDRLKAIYIARRFPRLSARSRFDLAALNQLFVRSGYLDLRAGEGVSEAWRSFARKSSLSCDVVYKASDGEPIGHVSITRAYANTWLMHQLATLAKHEESAACRTAIYDFGSSIPVLMDGDQARALAYFDLHKRWHQLFFHEFVRWVDAPSDAAIGVFDRFERGPLPTQEPPAEGDFVLQPAAQADLIAVASLVRSQLPAVLANALDVYPWTLRSENLLRRADAKKKLLRARDVIVLREGGTIRAAALCETGPSAASVFNILNMAQIYVHSGAHAPSQAGQLALLHAVRAFYSQRGVNDPLVIAPKDTFDGLADPGTQLAETMGAIALSASALRQWENFCRFHFGVQSLSPKRP
jgi:hypothetical protein